MNKELQVQEKWSPQIIMEDLQNAQKLCQMLMQTPHYQKMGEAGIFAIVQKAKALNVNPIDALNGGLYCVSGKVEMASNMMIQLIRQAGHSVTKDKRSNDEVCILHGKRKDNGDTWTESFSIPDAKRAGIYKNTWEKFPRNMLFARALSNLARQLFPDAIKGCYVEGEIGTLAVPNENTPVETVEVGAYETISATQTQTLDLQLNGHTEMRSSLMTFLKKNYGVEELAQMPIELYDKMIARIQTAEEQDIQLIEEEEIQEGVA